MYDKSTQDRGNNNNTKCFAMKNRYVFISVDKAILLIVFLSEILRDPTYVAQKV